MPQLTLLGLPAEIVRLILQFLDPEAFYICLLVCKLFREHALNSTSLLKGQLAVVPGPKNFSRNATGTPSEVLLKEFRERCSLHLYNGASRLADLHTWTPSADSPPKLRISKIVRWPSAQYDDDEDYITDVCTVLEGRFHSDGDHLMYIEVLADLKTVNLYRIEHDQSGYRPHLWNIIYSPSLPLEEDYEIRKLTTWVDTAAPPNMRLLILYQSKVCPAEIKLIMFRLHPEFGAMIDKITDVHNEEHKLVTDLAVTRSGRPVVLYMQHLKIGRKHTLVIYGRKGTEDEYVIDTDQDYFDGENPSGLVYRGSTIHITTQGFPQLPRWTLDSRPRERIRGRLTHLTWEHTFRGQSQGLTLATHHLHRVVHSEYTDEALTCFDSKLSLVISRSRDPYLRTGAYLLKSINRSLICSPWTLNTDLDNIRHYFVAELADPPDIHNLSNLGLGVAISPDAHRIALSNWKTIQVYAFSPKAFLDAEYSLGGAEGVPGDQAFVQGAGWAYYGDHCIDDGCVALDPLVLNLGAIVYGMEFRGEDELWAWTDKGLCRYNFGVEMSGKREVSILR